MNKQIRMGKRLIYQVISSFLSIVILVFSVLGRFPILIANGSDKIGNIEYKLSGQTLQFSGWGPLNIIVRKHGTEYYSFANCEAFYVKANISAIGPGVFAECQKARSISIASTVKSIGEGAFENCTALSQISIPEGVTTISKNCFAGCTSLYSVKLPSTLEKIEYDAFSGCRSLREIELPNSLKSIERDAFENCKALKKITIPDSVTSIGSRAFCNCTSMTECVIGNGITTLPTGLFSGCESLTSVVMPESVSKIEKNVFTGSSVEKIRIPESMTEIPDEYFKNVPFREVILHDKIAKIGKSAFQGSKIERINFPESLQEIGNYAFSGASFTYLDLSVPKVGNGAFSKCEQLKSVVIEPDCELGSGVFSSCTALKSVTVAEGKEQMLLSGIGSPIAEDAVVTIPKSMTYLCYDCRMPCLVVLNPNCDTRGNNGNIEIYPKNVGGCAPEDSLIVGYPYSISQHIAEQLWKCRFEPLGQIPDEKSYIKKSGFCGPDARYNFYPDGTLVITGTGAIDAHAFDDFGDNSLPGAGGLVPSRDTRLYHVYISEGITEIGEYAFLSDYYLKDVHFPNSLRVIGAFSFSDCLELQEVVLGTGTVFIGYCAFENCRGVHKVILNEGLKYIMDAAFSNICWYEEDPCPIVFPKTLEYCGGAFDFKPRGAYFLNPHTALGGNVFDYRQTIDVYSYDSSLNSERSYVVPKELLDLNTSHNSGVATIVREPKGYGLRIYTDRDGISHNNRFYTIKSESDIPDITPDAPIHRFFEGETITPYNVVTGSTVKVITTTTTNVTTTTKNTTTSKSKTTAVNTTSVKTTTSYIKVDGYTSGDVNGDGNVNAVDASIVLTYYAMISTNKNGDFNGEQIKVADVDNNCEINAVDASFILSYYAYTSTTKKEIIPIEEYMYKIYYI